MKKLKLTDLAVIRSTVETSRGTLEVEPLGLGEIAGIFFAFPELRSLLNAAEGGQSKDNIAKIADTAPDAVPHIIAAGCGSPGQRGRKAARALSATDQLIVMLKIFDLSFPEGLDGFLAAIETAAGKVEEMAPAEDEAEVEEAAT